MSPEKANAVAPLRLFSRKRRRVTRGEGAETFIPNTRQSFENYASDDSCLFLVYPLRLSDKGSKTCRTVYMWEAGRIQNHPRKTPGQPIEIHPTGFPKLPAKA